LTLEVREAQSRDLQAIVDLIGQLGYPSGETEVAGRVGRVSADPKSWVFVAVDDERIVGLGAVHVMSILERDDPIARVTAMVVAEGARGSGVGTALLDRLEDVARREGCDKIDLTTRYERQEAAAFYRRRGFKDTSRRFVNDLG